MSEAEDFLLTRQRALDVCKIEYEAAHARCQEAMADLMEARRRFNNAGRDWVDAAAVRHLREKAETVTSK